MNKTKRIISIVILLVFLFSTVLPVYANINTRRWSYIDEIYVMLNINSTLGIASCEGSVTAVDNYPVKIILSLQRYENGRWVTLKTWTAEDTEHAYKSGSFAIYSGYNYRAYAEGRVYDANGNIIETTTLAMQKSYGLQVN